MDSSLNSYPQPPPALTLHPTTTDFSKLNQLVMSPIPEKYQIRANRGIVESSQILRGSSYKMRETVKRLRYEEIQESKNKEAKARMPTIGKGEPTPVYLKSADSDKHLPSP